MINTCVAPISSIPDITESKQRNAHAKDIGNRNLRKYAKDTKELFVATTLLNIPSRAMESPVLVVIMSENV